VTAGEWRLGDVFVLRHAGMPFEWLEELGVSEDTADAADRALAIEEAIAEDVRTRTDERAARRVESAFVDGNVASLTARERRAAGDALRRWESAVAAFVRLYDDDYDRLRRRLRSRAGHPKVREAVFLSSPDMYEDVWEPYVEGEEPPSNSRYRRVERQVYSYLQRFCAKNETTSFFGPIAYGETRGGRGLTVRRGREPVRRTAVSYWAVNELARSVAADRRLRAHVPLRATAGCTVEDGTVWTPLHGAVAIDPETEAVFRAVESHRPTLAELSARLAAPLPDVVRRVTPLLRLGAAVRSFEIDGETFMPLESLTAAVAALPGGEARAQWSKDLAELDALRAEFEAAAFPRRRSLLTAIEDLFTRLTGVAARRGAGETYADRLVLSEEARSSFELTLGAELARDLEARLAPALEVSAAYGDAVQDSYVREASATFGPEDSETGFLSYAAHTRPEAVEGSRFAPTPVTLDRHALETGTHDRSRPGGRYALVDLCLEMADAAGEPPAFDLVLSRVHHHLLVWGWLSAFFPDRRRFERSVRSWLDDDGDAAGLVALAFPRRNKGFYSFPGPRLAYAGPPPASDWEVLRGSAFRVARRGKSVVLLDADGRERTLYLALADFTTYPPLAALSHPLVLHPRIEPSGEEDARLVVGRAILQRHRWRVEAREMPARGGGPVSFLALRRCARRRRLPRFVFVRFAHERKPFLVDTLSPFAAHLLVHLFRAGGPAVFEEMSPGPDGLWLRDDDGRYTCELRAQVLRSAGARG
jgi:hypothetical protein